MFITLFTYDRPEMLKETTDHIRRNIGENDTLTIYNDGVDFPHRGKKGFWKTWNEALKKCEENVDDIYLFMPEDFLNLDFDRVREMHERMKHEPYVFNIINDGRHQSWGAFKKQDPVNGVEQIGFCDGGFFCNRKALEAIGFYMIEINERRWKEFPNLSSGIGQQLTGRFHRAKVKMYKPVKSLAYHGDHESKMNPEERKKNPLISK